MPNPRIPEQIVVHLGAPDSEAMNVSVSFADYIKNVASSEIYPTWPKEALRANILAQISVALNRVYTEFYRSRGYNFDITNSPAYDQTFVYQRDIFSNISELVDEIFDSYIRREEFIEPLFATFCDGVEVTCQGLEQWGSVELAESGLDYYSILKNYYGDNIVIETDVPVEDIPSSAPAVTLQEGDTGRDVELIQRKLNRISANYPGIPKIYPADGFFDTSTTEAVRKFQEVFGLQVDGLVGRATWNQIQFIYNAVKKLYTVNSEGIRITDVSTRYTDTLSEGSSGDGVLTIQYYLSYISLFVPSVIEAAFDGSFGPATANAVRSFQRTYGLPETGAVDRATWDRMEEVYFGIVNEIDYEFFGGRILPFPGRVLREGIEGNDVRVLQEYLNYISSAYPEIPRVNVDGVFGPSTAEQVRAFKEIFDLPGAPDRVNAPIWNSIASVYDDLYTGGSVSEGQYPGYNLS
ncbi:MAG: spore cortex-lytic protein [Ruminococcaceae bacterium]|nr:spore cortex-lytic protein [Oscillospiraceae bacterium]